MEGGENKCGLFLRPLLRKEVFLPEFSLSLKKKTFLSLSPSWLFQENLPS